MNRVENIQIGGTVFVAEEQAYTQLVSYLDALNRHFAREEGGGEILSDIENRVAELLSKRPGGTTQVVTPADIDQVIAELGSAADITGESGEPEECPAEKPSGWQRFVRKWNHLYRDPDHRFLGGVCAGISQRFGVDPLIVRLLFILGALFYGIGIFLYLFLWFFVPLAQTTAQKLEMRGDPVNVQSIRDKRRQMNESGLEHSVRRMLSGESHALRRIVGILLLLGGVLVALFGVWTLLYGIPEWLWIEMMDEILDDLPLALPARLSFSPVEQGILQICGGLVFILPVLAFFLWGIHLLAAIPLKQRNFSMIMLAIWLCAVGVSLVTFLVEILRQSIYY